MSCLCAGYWNVIVYGRKHSYFKLLNEATRWANSIQNAIDTPTLQLIPDIRVQRLACLSTQSVLYL